MNEQKPPKGIEWTRRRLPDGTILRGYTWNPISGCLHGCAWTMPDGRTVPCYAETTAEHGVAKSAYPGGFAVHTFHPERLAEPLRVRGPAGIFLDSMSDLGGRWIPMEQVQQVLEVCRQAHWHTFFCLTKNAPRLPRFPIPPNVWVGVSSPPDGMWGHALTRSQQERMLHKCLQTLAQISVPIRWVSFEPLSWDCAAVVAQYPGAIQWAVIGAASDGAKHYPPAPQALAHLLDVLDGQAIPVFYKGNLRSLPMAAAAWRDHFPAGATATAD
jgi:protein gp37